MVFVGRSIIFIVICGVLVIALYKTTSYGTYISFQNYITPSTQRAPPPQRHPLHSYRGDTVTNRSAIASDKQVKIWISMGLCFSKNTDMYGKANYPYTEVTPLAIILWYHFVPNIQAILYLIYEENESEDWKNLYETNLLKMTKNKVELRWVKENGMSCVTKSQLIRMWAFQEPIIEDGDVIVTVDVNLFVVTSTILHPILRQNPDKYIWVFQWQNTAYVSSGIGATFNQNLIAAKSKGQKNNKFWNILSYVCYKSRDEYIA